MQRVRETFTDQPRYPLPAIPTAVEYLSDMVVVWQEGKVVQVYVEE